MGGVLRAGSGMDQEGEQCCHDHRYPWWSCHAVELLCRPKTGKAHVVYEVKVITRENPIGKYSVV